MTTEHPQKWNQKLLGAAEVRENYKELNGLTFGTIMEKMGVTAKEIRGVLSAFSNMNEKYDLDTHEDNLEIQGFTQGVAHTLYVVYNVKSMTPILPYSDFELLFMDYVHNRGIDIAA